MADCLKFTFDKKHKISKCCYVVLAAWKRLSDCLRLWSAFTDQKVTNYMKSQAYLLTSSYFIVVT